MSSGVQRSEGTILEVLAGMKEVLGAARFHHVLGAIGRRRVEEEWEGIAARESVEEGITELFARLSSAGWGRVEIVKMDRGGREARFRVHRGWEAAYQKALSVVWEASYMAGVLAECCGRLFSMPCAAEQVRFAAIEGDFDEIVVRAAARPAEAAEPAGGGDDKAAVIHALEQEIKERALTEAALRASERRLRAFVDSGMLGFSMTSPRTGWLEANDKLCEILGYPREELFQKTWPDLTHPEDLARDMAALRRLHGGEVDSLMHEKRFVRKDGRIAEVLLNLQVLRGPDRSVEYMVALVQDVTETKRAERELTWQVETIERQEEAIRTLSSPIIQVWEGVLALPIMGQLDAERAGLIMHHLLSRIAESRARYAIIDLTGVRTIDTMTSDHLLRILNTVGLLGGRAVVTGISPEVARAMVESGVSLSGVTTRSTLHEALRLCIDEGRGVRPPPPRQRQEEAEEGGSATSSSRERPASPPGSSRRPP